MSKKPFKIAFPVLNIGDSVNPMRAIVLFSFTKPEDPHLAFATCIDETGRVHNQVPIVMMAIVEASRNPITFIEAPNERGPQAGGGGKVLGMNGKPLLG